MVVVVEEELKNFAKTNIDVNKKSRGVKRRKMCEISPEVAVVGMGSTAEDIAAASIADNAGHLEGHDTAVGRYAVVEAAGTTQAPLKMDDGAAQMVYQIYFRKPLSVYSQTLGWPGR